MMRPRCLHLVSARGGGMCRFARDLLAPGDALLHVGGDIWVLELGATGSPATFLPYQLPQAPVDAAEWLDTLLDAHALDALHLHHLDTATLPLMEAWSVRGRPWLASLHDVGFLRADAFVGGAAMPLADVEWARRWRQVLARASAITAPSRFLADAFERACDGLCAAIVEPGIEHPDRFDLSCDRPLRSIAVVGALGAHKGKQRLLRWLAHPGAAAYRWTLIGYTEDQLQPGWIADGRLWVHGPFDAARTAHWLRHYAVDLVLFPNQLAESFSYALSDVWGAGVPVLVPDCGALGERVRAHGGGALLADPEDAGALMRLLAELRASATIAEWRAQIQSRGVAMAPSKQGMVAAMKAQYARLPRTQRDHPATAMARLQPWLRTQLDDVVFRHENIRLARDYAQVRAWADKQAADVARLQVDLDVLGSVRAQLDAQITQRDGDVAALRQRNAEVEAMAAALAARNGEVEASAARMQLQLAALDEHLIQRDSAIAELSAHNAALIAQLNNEQARAERLQQSSDQRATEIAIMHQRINALEMELRPLRVKGARYDRVAGWLPTPLRAALRDLLRWRRRLLGTEVRP
jgi:hypothetical protein